MRGIRRSLGVAPRTEAAPLSVAQLRAMIAASPEVTLRDLRDHCVLLLGFAGALRRSEIAALNWEDISFTEGGLILRLRRSKTDPRRPARRSASPAAPTRRPTPSSPSSAGVPWAATGRARSFAPSTAATRCWPSG
jgi:integrase